jgi:hypothetical protein
VLVRSRVERVEVGPRPDRRRPVDGDPKRLAKRLRISWRDGVTLDEAG